MNRQPIGLSDKFGMRSYGRSLTFIAAGAFIVGLSYLVLLTVFFQDVMRANTSSSMAASDIPRSDAILGGYPNFVDYSGYEHAPNDAVLQRLKSRGIDALCLSGTDVTDQRLKTVGTLKSLKWLSMQDTNISDKGVAHLGELSMLNYLDLSRTSLSEPMGIRKLTNLEVLQLDGTSLSDNGTQCFSGLTRLSELDLGRTAISNAAMAHVSKLSHLQFLRINETDVGNDSLEQIKSLRHLRLLAIQNTQINYAAVPVLMELESLTVLTIHHEQLGQDGPSQLRSANPDLKIFHEAKVD